MTPATMTLDELLLKLESWMPKGYIPRGETSPKWWTIIRHTPTGEATLKFQTAKHEFSIHVHTQDLTSDQPQYLGAMAKVRNTPRSGNDLADGVFCRETFNAIMRDVVAYEMVGFDG